MRPIPTPNGVSVRPSLRAGQSRSHIGAMHLDLTDEQAEALIRELTQIIENDRYPLISVPSL
jgi:hypothetical protein